MGAVVYEASEVVENRDGVLPVQELVVGPHRPLSRMYRTLVL